MPGKIISRKVGQKIHIGDDITITVLSKHGHIKLAIEAPRDVKISYHDELDARAPLTADGLTNEPKSA